MKVWITKFALTSGIRIEEVQVSEINQEDRLYCKLGNAPFAQGFGPQDWHRTEEDALERVLCMIEHEMLLIRRKELKLGKLEAGIRARQWDLK